MEMILRRLSIYLAVLVLEMSLASPSANATSRHLDFYVSVPNSTSHSLEFCNSDLTSCQVIPPAGEFFDAHDTSDHAVDYIRRWLAVVVVKESGKIVPLELLIDPPQLQRKPSGAVIFQIIINKQKYLKEFGDDKDW